MRIISILESEMGILSDRIAELMSSHDELIARLTEVPGIGTTEVRR